MTAENTATDLGGRIRHEREWLGFAPDLVANFVGVSAADIAAFEAGERAPTRRQLAALSELLGLSVARLKGEPLHRDPEREERLARVRGGRGLSPADLYTLHRWAEFLAHGRPPEANR